MIVSLTCTYCDHYFTRYVPKKSELNNAYCIKCGDSNLKIRDLALSKQDYYSGAPEFPANPDTMELLDFILTGAID